MTALLLGLRFLSELALLFALSAWGFLRPLPYAGRATLGIGAPLLAAVVWGAWIAPRARRRLLDPARLLVELGLFAVAGLAFAQTGHRTIAWTGTALAITLALAMRVAPGLKGR